MRNKTIIAISKYYQLEHSLYSLFMMTLIICPLLKK